MNWLWRVLSISLGAAALLLGVPCMLRLAWSPVMLILLILGIWGIALWKRSRLFNLAFISFMLLALYISVLPLPAIITLAAVTLLLVAWDLSEFLTRLREYDPGPAVERLARAHLERLSGVAALGFLLGGLALLLRLHLGFEVAVILGLFIFLGLGQVIRFLRSLSD